MNRNKLGSMVLGGDSIYLLECQSAAYAILASNEAEKEADVKLIDMRMIGANGRLYLAGTEADVRNAMNAAEMALRDAGAS
jgi:microcompartment protein CcmL/EutN